MYRLVRDIFKLRAFRNISVSNSNKSHDFAIKEQNQPLKCCDSSF